jgi:hypothetical protein
LINNSVCLTKPEKNNLTLMNVSVSGKKGRGGSY